MEFQSSGISISQAARMLGTTQSDVYQMMRQGQLPTLLVNGNRVLSQGTVLDYQARKRHHSTSYDRYL